jgi:hypothetical protein
MKSSKLISIAIIIVSFAYLTACDAPTNSGAEDTQDVINSIEDLSIPADFDWKTEKNISFTLSGYQTSSVRIVSESGEQYHRANLFADSEYSFELTVPAYMETIRVLYRGQEKEFELNRPEIVHNFEPESL